VIGVFMAIRMARRYSQPLERLASRSRRLRDLDLINYHPVESRLAEVNQLSEAHGQMLTAMQSFAKYTPIEVVRELLKRGEVAKIGGRTASLTLLFSDIRGFTTIAEGMDPQALADHMAEYFEEVLRVLRQNKATIDKFVGDAVVAFWGAPTPDPNHTQNAVQGVLRCSARLAQLNRDWEERGLPPLPTCFGLTTGSVVVGNIGSRSRLSYTVLGDAANLASRIEGINRLYGTEILAEEVVTKEAGDSFAWRFVDRVTVKGKSEAVRINELLGLKDEVPRERLQFAAEYEKALNLYHTRDFSGALEILERFGKPFAEDLSVNRLAGFCRGFLLHPPPADWDGVSHLEAK
jgi:adenylate cyclase